MQVAVVENDPLRRLIGGLEDFADLLVYEGLGLVGDRLILSLEIEEVSDDLIRGIILCTELGIESEAHYHGTSDFSRTFDIVGGAGRDVLGSEEDFLRCSSTVESGKLVAVFRLRDEDLVFLREEPGHSEGRSSRKD